MKCAVHGDRDVVGYCIECGAFGCGLCLVEKAKGESLCLKCDKARSSSARKGGRKGLLSKLLGEKETHSPAANRPSPGRASVARRAGTARKLIVHFKNNRIIKGTTYKLDLQSLGFYLIPVDSEESQDRIFVHFSDVKAIYYVRDFEGRFDPAQAVQEPSAEGQEVRVAFEDGEILEGRVLHHFDPACQRFFIMPDDEKGNNLSVLVEKSALKGLQVGSFREGVFAEDDEILSALEGGKKGRAPLSQNESMGDLYFSMKNYDAALAEYDKVREEYPHDKRLALKISVCNFNRGVNFIKSRKYLEAKAEFEKIGEDDPIYDKARKKTRKIEKILREAQNMGS